MPALVVVLHHAELSTGRALTYEEVIAIRDSGTCVMIPQSKTTGIVNRRGYPDINPDAVWEQWQIVRDTLPLSPKNS